MDIIYFLIGVLLANAVLCVVFNHLSYNSRVRFVNAALEGQKGITARHVHGVLREARIAIYRPDAKLVNNQHTIDWAIREIQKGL